MNKKTTRANSDNGHSFWTISLCGGRYGHFFGSGIFSHFAHICSLFCFSIFMAILFGAAATTAIHLHVCCLAGVTCWVAQSSWELRGCRLMLHWYLSSAFCKNKSKHIFQAFSEEIVLRIFWIETESPFKCLRFPKTKKKYQRNLIWCRQYQVVKSKWKRLRAFYSRIIRLNFKCMFNEFQNGHWHTHTCTSTTPNFQFV